MPKRWQTKRLENAIEQYTLRSWRNFSDLVETILSDVTHPSRDFIWRGQRRIDWSLSSSLDRLLDSQPAAGTEAGATAEERVQRHLDRFKMAVRGRRGQNPPPLTFENDWWALGQHYGLATPLLDWSRSPFAAAYFAFEEDHSDTTSLRVVNGLNRRVVELRNMQMNEGEIESDRLPLLDIFNTMSDENPRVVAQSGVFTRAPLRMPVEQWVSTQFPDVDEPVLYRILIPDTERTACLRDLNRMNISHLSLFPDLHGASRYVNLAFHDPTF